MASFHKDLPQNPNAEISTPQLHSNRKVEERMELLSARIEELAKLVNLKTERLMVKTRILEEKQEEMMQDFQKRLMAVLSKYTEIPKVELKVQELLERHNQVIRNFENRIFQLKRHVEHQEMQLMKAVGELEEARREIAKLKRL